MLLGRSLNLAGVVLIEKCTNGFAFRAYVSRLASSELGGHRSSHGCEGYKGAKAIGRIVALTPCMNTSRVIMQRISNYIRAPADYTTLAITCRYQCSKPRDFYALILLVSNNIPI